MSSAELPLDPSSATTQATARESLAETSFRTDIQALRGFAVLAVVLHHAGVAWLKAGYLGVDIFFVVSGFLITAIVRKGLDQGTFSFSAFYFRRAKRLLPAAYAVFLFTALFAPFFLTGLEARDFAKQLAGAITFTGNIALWLQTGYFETAASLKPLLHVWSLGIEEQYYLLLPAALAWTPRRFWLRGTVVVLLASFALCLLLGPVKPGATFYLLPTRGWELAIGSVGSLIRIGPRTNRWLALLFWPAMLGVLLVPVLADRVVPPGAWALAVCMATLIVILRAHHFWDTNLPARALARVGDFSYSLYLLHWPLFAFAANAYVSSIPVTVRAFLVLLAIAGAFGLYRWVEQPIRLARIRISPASVVLPVIASLGLLAFPLLNDGASGPAVDYAHMRRVNHGLDGACDFSDAFVAKAECQTSDSPGMLVWGDSFAMHLVPGIAATTTTGLVQATKSECSPFVGLSRFSVVTPGSQWARDCLQFNEAVLEYLAKSASIQIVVLSSSLNGYLENPESSQSVSNLARREGVNVEVAASTALALAALRDTASRIRMLGKRVVLVAPPPRAAFDSSKCLERKATNKVVLGSGSDCNISLQAYKRDQAPVLAFLNRAPTEAEVNVVGFDDALCGTNTCATSIDGIFVYRDAGHLSYDGSTALARRSALVQRIMAQAS
jgi:peptidoglycan/LPS O-acetylase OafA/YrhL